MERCEKAQEREGRTSCYHRGSHRAALSVQKKELVIQKRQSTRDYAKTLGISRSSLYYEPVLPKKDWELKCKIEEVLREHPSYGSRRVAIHLNINRKRAQRVMRIYGIRPLRRRGRKYRRPRNIRRYPNLLMTTAPTYPNHIWATDFTEVMYQKQRVYISTILDLYTRKIVGIHVAVRKGAPLSVQTLYQALLHHPRSDILHSDNGREYEARVFRELLSEYGITISRSKPGCPWENGYQESFYDKFKVDLGDPGRFDSLGELVAEIYKTIWVYNNTRIHSALKMPPEVFANRYLLAQTTKTTD